MDVSSVFYNLWDLVAYTAAPFILVLGVMIFIHELGHFLAARALGVKVLVFKLGFGKWIWKRTRGDFEYGIGVFPIGGYVKMFGDPTEVEGGDEDTPLEDISEEEKAQALYYRPARHKLLIFIAGPVMNILFGAIVAPLVFLIGVEQVKLAPEVGKVESGSPAAVAGIKPGDMVLSINNQELDNFFDLKKKEALNPNKSMVYRIKRDGETLTKKLTLREGEDKPIGESGIGPPPVPAVVMEIMPDTAAEKAGLKPGDVIEKINGERVSHSEISLKVNPPVAGALGAIPMAERRGFYEQRSLNLLVKRDSKTLELETFPRFSEEHGIFLLGIQHSPPKETVRYGLIGSVREGFHLCVDSVVEVYTVLYKLVTGQLSPRLMAGPVGIGAITSQAAHMGLGMLLKLTVLIGINLGLLNLLPFPPLDGGHVVVTLVESAMGREINMKVKEGVFWFGFMLLISLMVLVTINDFYNFGSGMLDYLKGLAEGLGL
ncbi:MAG: RIP metalloprotease RseP [bacterium]